MNRYQYQVYKHQLEKQLHITNAICYAFFLLVITLICFGLVVKINHIQLDNMITNYQEKQQQQEYQQTQDQYEIQVGQDQSVPIVSATPDATSILGEDETR